jgi:calpain-15
VPLLQEVLQQHPLAHQSAAALEDEQLTEQPGFHTQTLSTQQLGSPTPSLAQQVGTASCSSRCVRILSEDDDIQTSQGAELQEMPPPDGKFVDPEFPPIGMSISRSASEDDHLKETFGKPNGKVLWKRGCEVAQQLFDRVHPTDFMQGLVGDCWLLSGIAAIAEFPARIRRLFRETELSPTGRYHISIFDQTTGCWSWIPVDDYIPYVLKGGQRFPLGVQPYGDELWLLLLEKACAKWFGGYANIHRGMGLDTLMVLTECEQCRAFTQCADGTFVAKQVRMLRARDRLSYQELQVDRLTPEQLFQELRRADELGLIMVASKRNDPPPEAVKGFGSNGELIAVDGIVGSHSYPLIGVYVVHADGFTWRVLRIRNLWAGTPGTGWTGDLCDSWSGWGRYPELRRKLGVKDYDWADGVLYMLWDDFLQRFTDVGIAYDKASSTPTPVPSRHRQPSRKAQRIMSQLSPSSWPDLPEHPHAVSVIHEKTALQLGGVHERAPRSPGVRSPCVPDTPGLGFETQTSSAETLVETATQVLRKLPPKPRHPPPPEEEEQTRDSSPLGKAVAPAHKLLSPQEAALKEAAAPTHKPLSPREAALKEVALAAEEISLREERLREAAIAAEEISFPDATLREVPSPQRHRTRLVAALAADLRARAPRQSILKEVARQLLAMDEI